jgi:uncharacterized protein (DUF1778 family)
MARGRKPSPDSKHEKIELRVNREQKATLQAAAKRAGLPTATWIIALALEAARTQPNGADA